jgi:outer membrane protein OmpA-like peptidoglycan-associated protein
LSSCSSAGAAPAGRAGDARARAVCRFLTHGLGIATTADSYGAADPRATNSTPEGRALNRRVEIHISY